MLKTNHQFNFCAFSTDDYYLEITVGDINGKGTCQTAAFIMRCLSTNPNSIWQNFTTNDMNWVDSFGGNIIECSDRDAHLHKAYGYSKFIWVLGG